jgi:uncharacterized protein YndB with AHSA1/START domain
LLGVHHLSVTIAAIADPTRRAILRNYIMNTATSAASNEFIISRMLDAPREVVFKVWTEPKHLSQWWGPHNFTNPVCEIDLRVGGAHRTVMRGEDGTDYPIKGIFKEIVAPERLVMTMDCSEHPQAWHDMVNPNRAKGDNNPAGEMLQTVTFEDIGDQTLLTIRTRFESAAIRDAMVKMGMNEGWTESLERLEAYLEAI